MSLKLLFAVSATVVLSACWVAGAGATATATASTQAAALVRPELDTWSASPRLGVRAAMQVGTRLPDTAAEMEKVTLYVPAGYTLYPADPPGTREGHVFMDTVHDFAYGDLTSLSPAAYDNTPQAQACAPGSHVGVWIMDFSDGLFSSQTVTVPIYIDPTSVTDASLGAYKLQACLPLAHIASPGGYPLGSRLQDLTLEFARLTNPTTAGLYVWRAFVNNPDPNGNPDPATAYEVRSDMPLPANLTLSGRFVRSHRRAVLAGQLTAPAASVAGVPVGLYRRGSFGFWTLVASTRTVTNGSYRFVRPIRKTATFGTEAWTVADCKGDSTAPNGCISESFAAIDSRSVKVVVPRRH